MDKNQLPPLGQASIFDVRAMSEAERASLGYLVLVMRRWPQGFSWEALDLQLWLPDAGPSPELLKAYQAKQIDWEEFAQRYRVEQIGNWRRAGYYKVGKGDVGRRESQMSPLQHLDELRRQYGLVTVLCHERKGHCHRYVLEKLAHDKDGNEQSTSQILEPPTMQEQEKPLKIHTPGSPNSANPQ
jgi:uncharacterized protein YeaO (DUF488 family)